MLGVMQTQDLCFKRARDHGTGLMLRSAVQPPQSRERRKHTTTEEAARCRVLRVMKTPVRMREPHPNRQRRFDTGSLAMGLLCRRNG